MKMGLIVQNFSKMLYGLVIGLCAVMNNRYFVSSNIESGHGRYDIQLAVRIDSQLEAAAKGALDQIEEKKYVTTMKKEGFTHFFKIGAAFYEIKKH